MSRWEQLTTLRRQAIGCSLLFFVLTLSFLAAQLVGKDVHVPAAVFFAALMSHAVTVIIFSSRLADLQAAEDMRRISRGEQVE